MSNIRAKEDLGLEVAVMQLVKQYGIEKIVETVNRNYKAEQNTRIKIIGGKDNEC